MLIDCPGPEHGEKIFRNKFILHIVNDALIGAAVHGLLFKAAQVSLGVLGVLKIKQGSPPLPEQAIREAKLTTEALKSDGR